MSKMTPRVPDFIPCDKSLPWKEQYKHPNWQKMRLYILERDRYTCTKCGATSKQLHIDHSVYNKHGMIWEVAPETLNTVCYQCHEKKHNKTFSYSSGPWTCVKDEEELPLNYATLRIDTTFMRPESHYSARVDTESSIHEFSELVWDKTRREVHLIALIAGLKVIPDGYPVAIKINSMSVMNYLKYRKPTMSSCADLLNEFNRLLGGRTVSVSSYVSHEKEMYV